MCAFMPATANWIGAMSRRARRSKSGSQARGVLLGSLAKAAWAVKKRSAKPRSSASTKALFWNVWASSWAATPSVTSR